MPTLFPPLGSTTSTTTTVTKTFSKSAAMASLDDDESMGGADDVLPPELAHNFETLRSLLAKSEDAMNTKRESEDGALNNPPDVKRRKQAEELAVATALVVEREVAFLENGIGELEAMLAAAMAAQQDISLQPEAAHRHRSFPALPPLVPDDDEYEKPNHCSKHGLNKVEELAADGNYREGERGWE